MELKHSRKEYIFNILDFVSSRISDDAFKNIVFTNTNIPLYCYSTHSLKQLINIRRQRTVYLNTSKKINIRICGISYINYKHYYKFCLKPNCYGLDVNKFTSLFSEQKQKAIFDALYGKSLSDTRQLVHRTEEEIIVDFNSLEFIEELNYNK